MVCEILLWPDECLSQNSVPVAQVDEGIRSLVADMFETMYAAEGVGLAAPQLGIHRRVVVLDVTSRLPDSKPLALINPEILQKEGSQSFEEGCLSLPGEFETVERAAFVKIAFLDEQGAPQLLECEGFLAIVIQHEMDHLNGVVFVDKVSPLKRELIRKRMKRLKNARAQA
ncbi:MAG: peptide deformylase [Proteobacteria bacterium]|nr:peptide deformylase [Cystobacterineae bacterium]MCL2259097.1 peptide deformylase [Cystobacterineae bacterium]MCL2314490.1 peptide deformylase [Pseudomonadota bacterium]